MYEGPGLHTNASNQKHGDFEGLQKLIECDRRRCSLIINGAVYAHFNAMVSTLDVLKTNMKGADEALIRDS